MKFLDLMKVVPVFIDALNKKWVGVTLGGATDSGGSDVGEVLVKDAIVTSQQELLAHGVVGVNDNDVVYTSPTGIQEYDSFVFQQTQTGGSVDIAVKYTALDTAFSDPTSLIDLMVADPKGTRVLSTTGIVKRYALLGKFYQIQVSQNGATASNIEGAHNISNSGV